MALFPKYTICEIDKILVFVDSSLVLPEYKGKITEVTQVKVHKFIYSLSDGLRQCWKSNRALGTPK